MDQQQTQQTKTGTAQRQAAPAQKIDHPRRNNVTTSFIALYDGDVKTVTRKHSEVVTWCERHANILPKTKDASFVIQTVSAIHYRPKAAKAAYWKKVAEVPAINKIAAMPREAEAKK